jgi:hypothetical protein
VSAWLFVDSFMPLIGDIAHQVLIGRKDVALQSAVVLALKVDRVAGGVQAAQTVVVSEVDGEDYM